MKDKPAMSVNLTLESAQKRIEKLSSLIEIGTLVNSTLDLAELLTLVMKIAEKVMDSQASSLMLIDEKTHELVFQVATGEKGHDLKEKFRLKMGQGIAGWVALNDKPLLVRDVRKDPRFYSKPDESTGFITRSIICVPMRVKGKIIGVLQAINPLHQTEFCEEDVEIFSAFANQGAIAIENARMHREMLVKQRIEQELDFARQIQKNFLPDILPAFKEFHVYALNVPAREVSGDFYDVLEFAENRWGVIIGDVSGKGVPSGLYMVKTISSLRFEAHEDRSVDETLAAVNQTLTAKPQFGMFSTLCYMIFDLPRHRVILSNAGALSPLVIDHKARTITEITEGKSTPLGIMSDVTFESFSFDWKPGLEILLFSDGILEARNPVREEFGMERLKQVIISNFGSIGLAEPIHNAAVRFSAGAPQHDDMTVMAIGYHE